MRTPPQPSTSLTQFEVRAIRALLWIAIGVGAITALLFLANLLLVVIGLAFSSAEHTPDRM